MTQFVNSFRALCLAFSLLGLAIAWGTTAHATPSSLSAEETLRLQRQLESEDGSGVKEAFRMLAEHPDSFQFRRDISIAIQSRLYFGDVSVPLLGVAVIFGWRDTHPDAAADDLVSLLGYLGPE